MDTLYGISALNKIAFLSIIKLKNTFGYCYHFYVFPIKRRTLCHWIVPGLHIVMGVRARRQTYVGAAARLSVSIYANFFFLCSSFKLRTLTSRLREIFSRDFSDIATLKCPHFCIQFGQVDLWRSYTLKRVCMCFGHTHFCHQVSISPTFYLRLLHS